MFGVNYKQENINAGRDVAGRDINHYHTPIVTWYQRRFRKLAMEIESDQRYNDIIDDLSYYNTVLDGSIGLERKLQDGGCTQTDIECAIRQKLKFAKKQEKYKYYESAQYINSHLFAEILMKFNDCVKPLICSQANKVEVFKAVSNNVIHPILDKLNIEGADDDYLCYDAEDIYGMVYYLTGTCHINWKDYENV